nr:hypothetical protein [uncultured Brevundimonas sp.]
MNRSQVENWSAARCLAFLAAVFAIVLGSLVPFAAMAAAQPGHPVVLCSSEGPQTIHVGGVDGPAKKQAIAKCAACLQPLAAALPAPPAPQPQPPVPLAVETTWPVASAAPPPPARAPPRPPSTAPPLA